LNALIAISAALGSKGRFFRLASIPENESLRPEDFACTNAGHGRYHAIVRCYHCGFLFSNPRDTAETIAQAYHDVDDNSYDAESKGREVTFRKAIRRLEKITPRGRLLDIGCYTGIFLKEAAQRGWDVMGIEPSAWAVKIAQEKYGLRVQKGNISDLDCAAGKFDVITLWDVLEHIHDPARTLTLCCDKLVDGGIVVAATMRSEGWFYRLSGKRWPWFMRMHLYYFTFQTLKTMFEKCGFEVFCAHTYTHYVSLRYLFYKAGLVKRPYSGVAKKSLLQKFIVPVDFGDFIEVYAKKRKLT